MKQKNSHCMSKIRYISLLCLLACSMAVSAQTYERVFRNNFWNASENIAGIRQDSVSRSYAELYGHYEGGGFRDTWQGTEGWSTGAATASIRHLERMSLAGSFSFDQTEGYGMCGSMFIKPGSYPVDVLEFTPGRKTLQTYAFDGGISYDLTGRWRIGAKMDFESANMAKRKDLRHDNWRLDMTVAPGFIFHRGDFAIGAAGIFRKTSETINPEQIGTAESSYHAFLDKGLMYGVYSVWTGNGVHLDEDGVKGFPVNDLSYGLSAQLEYKGLFADLKYLRSHGKVGEKEYIWFEFPGNEAGIDLGYKLSYADDKTHFFRLGFAWKGLEMSESILEKVTENGVTTIWNHGWNKILAHSSWSLNPDYEYISDRWEIHAEACINESLAASSQMYPYLYTRSLLTWNVNADAAARIGRFEIRALAGFGKGSSEEDGIMTDEGTGVQTKPYRLEDWYARHMDYVKSPRLNAGLSVRCDLWKGLYVKAEGSWMHGFDLQILKEPDRYGASLRIGYTF